LLSETLTPSLMVYVVGEELSTKGRIIDESDGFYN
jgi:hypothetical protein